MSSQCVFLFDLNILPESEVFREESLQAVLNAFRSVCLRLFAEFANDSSNFRFGAKFFSTCGVVNRDKEKSTFQEVSAESFQTFIARIFDRYIKYNADFKNVVSGPSLPKGGSSDKLAPVKALNDALKEILCSFEWNVPEICSPVRRKGSLFSENVKRNFVFMFTSCPSDLRKFCGLKSAVTSLQLKNLLMPRALHSKFVEDASINLIWLDTVNLFPVDSLVSQDIFCVQKIVESVMADLRGMLMPIQVLSHISIASEYEILPSNCQHNPQSQLSDNRDNMVFKSLWWPFSQLFSYFLGSSHHKHLPGSCEIFWPRSKSFKVTLMSTFVRTSRPKNGVTEVSTKSSSDEWKRFVVRGTVSKTFYKLPDEVYFCHSESLDMMEVDIVVYHKILKKLCCQNQYLVLQCKMVHGSKAIGLLSSFSPLTAVILLYYLPTLLEVKDCTQETKEMMGNFDDDIKNLVEEMICQTEDSDLLESLFGINVPKLLPVDSAETWLKTETCAMQKITNGIVLNGCLDGNALRKQLLDGSNKCRKRNNSEVFSPPRQSRRIKQTRYTLPAVAAESESTVMNFTSGASLSSSETSTAERNTEEQVFSRSQMLYHLALEQSKLLVTSAHSIVTDVLVLLKSKKENVNKHDLVSFMNGKLLTAPEMLLQMYDGKTDMESLDKRTKEYQMQILLHLEVEAAFPSLSVSRCSEKIIMFLKGMIAATGRTQVAQFLREYIRENYRHSLHHVLKDIELDLGISFLRQSLSQGSAGFSSPASSTQSSTKSLSSVASHKSSSSVMSHREHRVKKSSISRSIFSSSISKRQISLSQDYGRKHDSHKANTGQFGLNRRSPRLTNLNLRFGDLSPRTKRANVRRNLFNTAFRTPERQKKALPVSKSLKRASPNKKAIPVRRSLRYNKEPPKSTPSQRTNACSQISFSEKSNSSLSFSSDSGVCLVPSSDLKDEEAVITAIIKMRESAVKENESLLAAARGIVNTVISFLKSQKDAVCKGNLVDIIKDKILITPKNITELYEGESSQQIQAEKAREYEIQVLLNLEVEAAFASSSPSSDCVDMVVSLLRGMLFTAGHDRVSKFLQDSVRENYCHNLRHILLGIEEELGVSIVEDSEESTPQKDTSPDPPAKSSKSMPLFQSSSSASVIEEPGPAKKASTLQRSFSSDFHNRQIMVPSELLKKHKSNPRAAIRRSPRISGQRKRMLSSAPGPNPKRIRRNLFNSASSAKTSESSSHTSRSSQLNGKQAFTPRGHHILKTTFVPETPQHRQGRSSVRNRQYKMRKMSGMLNSDVEEVAESPVNNRQEDIFNSRPLVSLQLR